MKSPSRHPGESRGPVLTFCYGWIPAFAGMTILLLSCSPCFASLSTDPVDEAVAKIDTIVQRKNKQTPVINELIAALKNPDVSVRVKERAAWALGELEAKSAVPTLIQSCGHKGLLVRSASLNALIHIRSISALPTFVTIAKTDPILSLRQDATLGLGLLQSDKAIDPLVKLSSDESAEVRGAAALAMGALQSKKNDFSELLKEIEKTDANPYVQERAKKALAVAERKNSAVLEQMNSDDADVRLFGALYFTNHGTTKELKTLKSAANSEADEETRAQLQKAVNAIKKRAAAAEAAKKKEALKP